MRKHLYKNGSGGCYVWYGVVVLGMTCIIVWWLAKSRVLEGYTDTYVNNAKSELQTFWTSAAYTGITEIMDNTKKNVYNMDLSKVINEISENIKPSQPGETSKLNNPENLKAKTFLTIRLQTLQRNQTNVSNISNTFVNALNTMKVPIVTEQEPKGVMMSLGKAMEQVTNELKAIQSDLNQIPD